MWPVVCMYRVCLLGLVHNIDWWTHWIEFDNFQAHRTTPRTAVCRSCASSTASSSSSSPSPYTPPSRAPESSFVFFTKKKLWDGKKVKEKKQTYFIGKVSHCNGLPFYSEVNSILKFQNISLLKAVKLRQSAWSFLVGVLEAQGSSKIVCPK